MYVHLTMIVDKQLKNIWGAWINYMCMYVVYIFSTGGQTRVLSLYCCSAMNLSNLTGLPHSILLYLFTSLWKGQKRTQQLSNKGNTVSGQGPVLIVFAMWLLCSDFDDLACSDLQSLHDEVEHLQSNDSLIFQCFVSIHLFRGRNKEWNKRWANKGNRYQDRVQCLSSLLCDCCVQTLMILHVQICKVYTMKLNISNLMIL